MAHDEPLWLPHNGQGAPDLPSGTRVQVRFSHGEETSISWYSFDQWDWAWPADGSIPREYQPYFIVAYRVCDAQ